MEETLNKDGETKPHHHILQGRNYGDGNHVPNDRLGPIAENISMKSNSIKVQN
jgi:hypothetical protein